MATKYANFFKFGKSLNNNIGLVNDPANPLTQAIIPDYNTHFNHGPTAHWSRTWDSQSTAYMKELANGMHGATTDWNQYCETYYIVNTETWPNVGAINAKAFTTINSIAIPKNTVGQNLLRNALELHCIYYPSATFKKVQFDPNIANSPIVNIPHLLCGNCPAIVYLTPDLDNNRIINAVLKDPLTCTDVLCYIWAALFHPNNESNIRLSNKNRDNKAHTKSKLYQYLYKHSQYFNNYFQYIMRALGEPCDCSKCQTVSMYTPQSQNHPYHPNHKYRKSHHDHANYDHHRKYHDHHHHENYEKKQKVQVLSADGWCGYSKKMTAQESSVKQALNEAGYDCEFVNGSQNKKKLDELSKKHGVRGFPTTLIHGKDKVHKVSGYMQPKQLVEKIKEKIK